MFASLTWIDITILVIIIASMIISVIRGFVKEALSLIVWILAFVIAAKFATPLSNLIVKYVANDSVRLALSFLFLFVVTLILGSLINFLISELVIKTGLSGTNRLLGLVFGILRGVVVIALLILLAELTALPSTPAWKNSRCLPYAEPVAVWLKTFLPDNLAKYFAFADLNFHNSTTKEINNQLENKGKQ